MLWRVRTTLPDRPGSLAALAQECGKAGVNILGLRVFPDVASVTDELVVSTPATGTPEDLRYLLERSGGAGAVVLRCTEETLTDQPTRYVEAARTVLARPASFPEVVARLFDAGSDVPAGPARVDVDVMELSVGDVAVQLRRTTPFTATEHARGAAMADLVTDVLTRHVPAPDPHGYPDQSLEYVVDASSATALAAGTMVGRPSSRARPAIQLSRERVRSS